MKYNADDNDSYTFRDDISDSDLLGMVYTKRKILILGGQEVGKTSIIKRYKNNIYIDDYEPTIQTVTKKLINFNDENIYFEIMDLEGQTQYTIFSPNKFSFGFNGYILVYDVKNMKSFELIKFIYEQVNILSGNISKILVGTKCDKDIDEASKYERQVTTDEAKKFAEKIHCPFLEVSSKDNVNIDEIFRLLLIEINKAESGINLKKMKFLKLYQFFLHHYTSMIYIYYINFILFLFLSIVFFFFGIYKEFHGDKKEQKDYYFGIGFPYTIFGIFGILISVGGFIGIKNKDIFLLNIVYLGLIYAGVFAIISIAEISLINNYQSLDESSLLCNICQFIIALIPLIIGIILSRIFKVIFQKDLKSYMA